MIFSLNPLPITQILRELKFGAKGRREESLESFRAVGVMSELLRMSPYG